MAKKIKIDHRKAMRITKSYIAGKLGMVGHFLQAIVDIDTPVKEGFLKGQNYHRVIDSLKLRIGNTAYYAFYVEFGTGIHAENGRGRQTAWVYMDSNTGEYRWTKGQKPQHFIMSVFDYEKEIKKMLAS